MQQEYTNTIQNTELQCAVIRNEEERRGGAGFYIVYQPKKHSYSDTKLNFLGPYVREDFLEPIKIICCKSHYFRRNFIKHITCDFKSMKF